MEEKREELERMGESEELKGPRRRVEVEKRKKDIGEYRVKVSYSMPLWLREKINKESLEQGLYQWEYIAKMIKRAENCPENSNYEQLREENEQLKKEDAQLRGENEQLKGENERLKVENEQLKKENEQLKVRNSQLEIENEDLKVELEKMRKSIEVLEFEKEVILDSWDELAEKLDDIIDFLDKYDTVLETRIRQEKGENIEFYLGLGKIKDFEDERKDVKKLIKFLKDYKKRYYEKDEN